MFQADLHIHSKFSRACSRDCDIEHLAWWAARKGICVVGTGDFTHPAWFAELRDMLEPAEPGLFKLRPGPAARLRQTTPGSCDGPVRFMLSAEISTIYRAGERTRKVHHLIFAPSFAAAEHITAALAKIGNLASDGRPILGLDSRHLLEITLEGGPGCYLVPAHAWTPWFAVLGSKSGFDTVAECYGDLAEHVFAIETGLSSDPAMNWMCSSLDRYRLMSNSDAHSPPMLGREATSFATDLDYFAIAGALRTGDGLAGTIEFYPEEGKYHLDGHRKCGVRFAPQQSAAHSGSCPECGKPLTIGVLHRVADLADREPGYRPAGAPGFTNLISLPQVLAEITGTGRGSKKVTRQADRIVAALGPELGILTEAPLADIARAGGSLLAEGIARLRRDEVRREAGYDGEYGTVSLFDPAELGQAAALFDLSPPPGPKPPDGPEPAVTAAGRAPSIPPPRAPADQAGPPAADGSPAPGPAAAVPAGAPTAAAPAAASPAGARETAAAPDPAGAGRPEAADPLLAGLDAEQRAAARQPGPLMIIAGPGTGKTRTLAYRIARQIRSRAAAPEACLALTFTRRAAGELRERLAALLPGPAGRVTVTTFHGLGLAILREQHERAGLPPDFGVAGDAETLAAAAGLTGSQRAGQQLIAAAGTDPAARAQLTAALAARNLVGFDELIERPAALLERDPALAAGLAARWTRISVDEYQDIDAAQYRLLRLLAADGRGLTAIGDPDQAIYGFRGADVRFFLAFGTDYPGARTQQLTRSYRSSPQVVRAAGQLIGPATLVPGRKLRAVAGPGPELVLHQAADEQAEAEWIARTIDQLLGGATFHALDTGRAGPDGHEGLSLADVAILYRTDAQAAALLQALDRAGLPARKGSHDRLTRRPAVAQLVREMQLAGPEPAGQVAARLAAAVRRLAALAPAPAGAAPGITGAAVGYRTAGELLAPLARRCGTDLDQFCTEIALGAEADALDPRADAITLLTLHAAKGLEFEVVFLAGCESGLLPLRRPGSPLTAEDLAAERRLLFVGMTRARTRLLLTCASQRARWGAARDGGPSPFLAAVEPGLLARPQPPRPRRPAQRQLRLL